ncbi:MAG: ImmA/IrrE family metallo-endopeptidase [Zoogloeaceae bacterium]|nr:ImmA/IrrE family metallo-endopeptidase [Zoogloeaceae bacterium]
MEFVNQLGQGCVRIYNGKMAKSAAQSLLNEIWGDRGLPVDPAWIASRLGIVVKLASLPEKVSGAIIKDAGCDPVILLAQNDSNNRQRFTCAHELGHYVSNQGSGTFEYVDLRNGSSNPEETWANEFAGNLLMPERLVREMAARNDPAIVMSWRFGVSMDAMSIRLKRLGIPVE